MKLFVLKSYLIVVTLFCFLLVTVWPNFAQAKDVSLEVTFTMEAAQTVDHYNLYCEKVAGSGVNDLVGTLNDTAITIWAVDVTDIPPGQELNWFMSAVDLDGDEGFSPAYPFKLTGNPNIISIKIIK